MKCKTTLQFSLFFPVGTLHQIEIEWKGAGGMRSHTLVLLIVVQAVQCGYLQRASTVFKTNWLTETQTITEKVTDCTATTTACTAIMTTTTTVYQTRSVMEPEPIEIERLELLSYDQFKRAVSFYNLTSAGGFPPTPSPALYHAYTQYTGQAGLCLVEQAMLLANLIWESTGFQHRQELACKGESKPSERCPYGLYHGRGYIQLSWDYNYRAASNAIFGDDRLLMVPDLAIRDDVAWQIAIWYWETHVQPRLLENNAIAKRHFGYAVRAINGHNECSLPKLTLKNMRSHPSKAFTVAINRLVIFNAILKDLGLATKDSDLGTLDGCLITKPEAELIKKLEYLPALEKAMIL